LNVATWRVDRALKLGKREWGSWNWAIHFLGMLFVVETYRKQLSWLRHGTVELFD